MLCFGSARQARGLRIGVFSPLIGLCLTLRRSTSRRSTDIDVDAADKSFRKTIFILPYLPLY